MNELKKRIVALEGEPIEIENVDQIELDGAIMYIVKLDGWMLTSIIVYLDGTLFHLRDWQSGNPMTKEEIEDYEWLTEDGHTAIVLNGQPRSFFT